ncbi:MAG: hypothetical protein JWM27_2334, partial [Gemmatimonadetes bacterium]|nr:hypothetical protein [Gemmatimonadota bacterium]
MVAVSAAACGPGAPEGPWTERTLAGMTLRDRAAQLVAPAVPDPRDTVFRAALLRERVGGVLLTGGGARDAAALLDTLARAQTLPPLAFLSMDRGAGESLSGAAEFPLAGAMGAAADSAA